MHKVEHQKKKKQKEPLDEWNKLQSKLPRLCHQLGMHVFGESRETCSYLKYRKGDPLSPLIKYSSCGGMGEGGGGLQG